MKEIKNKKELVEKLVNTFNDRDELHIQYKNKMKHIFHQVIVEFELYCIDKPDMTVGDLDDWIDNFVEERFKPID